MLGELIGECSGSIGGIRVVTTGGGETALEVTLRGQGSLLGQEITDFGTLVQPVGGSLLRGRAHHVMMTADGEAGDWSGSGVGQPTGAGFKSSWGASGEFASPQGSLARLDAVITVVEFDVEEDGSYRWRMWDWTGAGTP